MIPEFADKYYYEVTDGACLYNTCSKYENALARAIELYKLGHTTIRIVHKKSQEFDITSPEEIKQKIEDDLLTFEVSDVEYWVEVGAPKEFLVKLANLMNELEIAAFKLDLKDFQVKEKISFAKSR